MGRFILARELKVAFGLQALPVQGGSVSKRHSKSSLLAESPFTLPFTLLCYLSKVKGNVKGGEGKKARGLGRAYERLAHVCGPENYLFPRVNRMVRDRRLINNSKSGQ